METVDSAIRYIFVLTLVLIIVAYFTGASGILKTLFGGLNTTILDVSGQAGGTGFNAYPTGG